MEIAKFSILIEEILEWWNEHEFDTYSSNDDKFNVFDTTPSFIKTAKELKSIIVTKDDYEKNSCCDPIKNDSYNNIYEDNEEKIISPGFERESSYNINIDDSNTLQNLSGMTVNNLTHYKPRQEDIEIVTIDPEEEYKI